ncbi:MAG: hypothetical protein A2248_11530 [Candidatus Raymondbacteria bacterium RIFOXYA2_FULL_49_16]|nr:MAG: hypothetical protein A2248_11530 [Candidatus Raymondbacteria bacterium RIFOXYA2_FULL_49_16]OGP42222.1 MAG: hypothetical protein A2324_02370 [Candidatus Raymondbacteria bacterium RIFOXYB2_FULL_49_35]
MLGLYIVLGQRADRRATGKYNRTCGSKGSPRPPEMQTTRMRTNSWHFFICSSLVYGVQG